MPQRSHFTAGRMFSEQPTRIHGASIPIRIAVVLEIDIDGRFRHTMPLLVILPVALADLGPTFGHSLFNVDVAPIGDIHKLDDNIPHFFPNLPGPFLARSTDTLSPLDESAQQGPNLCENSRGKQIG